MHNLLEEVQELFRDVFDRKDIVLTRNSSAADVDDWDSLNHIILIAAIERKYKVKFGLGQLQDLKNVGDLIDLLDSKLAAKV